MRKKIKQLARGEFKDTKPELIFSENEIVCSVMEDAVYEGEFTFENVLGTKLRGIVYATNPRMQVLTPQFEGEKVRIRYQFNSYGLTDGETEKGHFVIVCEQNEVGLSFCVSIIRNYIETSIGPIKNLYDFSCLAKENWQEAFSLFYHKDFSNLIKANETKEQMLYKGTVQIKPSHQNMEEFLIGICKKEKVVFDIDRHVVSLADVTERVSEGIEVKKEHWGYIEIAVSTENAFLQIEKDKIYTEDFIGGMYHLHFFVDPRYLHDGKNYGKIEFSSVYETMSVDVIVNVNTQTPNHLLRMEKKKCRAAVMELYEAYRLKRIGTATWAKETITHLERLYEISPKVKLYLLMKAHCLLLNGQRQDAEWALDRFKRNWAEKNHPWWAYYLYLLTLIEREPRYVEKLIREIEMIYRKYPYSVLMFWLMLFLEEDYLKHPVLKLNDLEEWVLHDCSSPYLYIEAFDVICEEPELLTKLGRFEQRILRWAVRQKALTKGVAARIFQLMKTAKGFSSILYDLMCAAYEVDPMQEYLGIICSYLIRGQQFDNKYHKWYALGIEAELRINGLYEAYVCAMDERTILSIPKIIQMYFQYDNKLSYKKLAVLYNNIITSKEKTPEVYQRYSRIMSKFTMEQILAGHIDDNLAMIYDDMLDLSLINEEIAKALSPILFTQKIVTYDKKMIRAIIYQSQKKEPQIVSIQNNVAYCQLYSDEYVILFEDAKGNRFSGSVAYQVQALMDVPKYLERCIQFLPDQIAYLIAYLNTKQNYLTLEKEDQKYFYTIMLSDEVSADYKSHLLSEILRFCQMHGMYDRMQEYLLLADYDHLKESVRKLALEFLIEQKLYAFAYPKIKQYGMDQISSSAKVALAEYLITEREEKDEELLELALAAFEANQYSEILLTYLCKHYHGPTGCMMKIWKKAAEYDLERSALSERILVQMLYTETMHPEANEVFVDYYKHESDTLLILAYISYCAHAYFIHKQRLQDEILDLIEARYAYHLELNDVCKLALLKHYADVSELSEQQFAIEDALLEEFTRQEVLFAFYKYLHPKLVLKYHLYDKVFLEYRTAPNTRVVLQYSRDEDGDHFIKEEMTEVYSGIFVKTFVMFFGEEIRYSISEESQNEAKVVEKNRMINNDIYNENDSSRYHLLNMMLISNVLQEKEELYQVMKQYAEYDEVTKNVFQLL